MSLYAVGIDFNLRFLFHLFDAFAMMSVFYAPKVQFGWFWQMSKVASSRFLVD